MARTERSQKRGAPADSLPLEQQAPQTQTKEEKEGHTHQEHAVTNRVNQIEASTPVDNTAQEGQNPRRTTQG